MVVLCIIRGRGPCDSYKSLTTNQIRPTSVVGATDSSPAKPTRSELLSICEFTKSFTSTLFAAIEVFTKEAVCWLQLMYCKLTNLQKPLFMYKGRLLSNICNIAFCLYIFHGRNISDYQPNFPLRSQLFNHWNITGMFQKVMLLAYYSSRFLRRYTPREKLAMIDG